MLDNTEHGEVVTKYLWTPDWTGSLIGWCVFREVGSKIADRQPRDSNRGMKENHMHSYSHQCWAAVLVLNLSFCITVLAHPKAKMRSPGTHSTYIQYIQHVLLLCFKNRLLSHDVSLCGVYCILDVVASNVALSNECLRLHGVKPRYPWMALFALIWSSCFIELVLKRLGIWMDGVTN